MEQISLKDWLVRLFFLFLFGFMINRLFFFSPGIAESTTSYLLYPIIKIQKTFTDPISIFFSKENNVAVLQKNLKDLQEQNEDLY